MEIKTDISLQTKQVLSQVQMQSLNILSMSMTELEEFLQNEEIENPLATAIVTGDKPLMGAHLSAEDGKVKLDTI